MKKIPLFGVLLLTFLNTAHAQEAVAAPAGEHGSFCLYPAKPSAEFKYAEIKAVKVAKGSYGGVTDVLPVLVAQAKGLGANAIVNYAGSQRFGLLPWRLVRPIVRGTAIKFEGAAPDCAKSGGTTYAMVMATNKAPDQHAAQPAAESAAEPAAK